MHARPQLSGGLDRRFLAKCGHWFKNLKIRRLSLSLHAADLAGIGNLREMLRVEFQVMSRNCVRSNFCEGQARA
jgi:hypothetical protein